MEITQDVNTKSVQKPAYTNRGGNLPPVDDTPLQSGSVLGKDPKGLNIDRLAHYNLERQTKAKQKYEGLTYNTKTCGDVIITDYVTGKEVYVIFKNTGSLVRTEMGNLRKGAVKDPMLPTVHGVGITGGVITKHNGEHTQPYRLWQSVLQRCYSERVKLKYKAYSNCQVSDYFKYYPNFKEWCEKQVGFGYVDDNGDNFQLDKDLLSIESKVYSEHNCCFVPREINNAITKSHAENKPSRTGVCFYRGKFVARVSRFNVCVKLGQFNTEQEAFLAYKKAKEGHLKELAEKWKDQIDPRAYEALMDYQVEITD